MGLCASHDRPPAYSALPSSGSTQAVEHFRDFHRKNFNLNLVGVLEEFYERRERANVLAVQEEFAASLFHVVYTDEVFQRTVKEHGDALKLPGEWELRYYQHALPLYRLAKSVFAHVHRF